jgi:hypothetical protein
VLVEGPTPIFRRKSLGQVIPTKSENTKIAVVPPKHYGDTFIIPQNTSYIPLIYLRLTVVNDILLSESPLPL